MGRPRPLFGVLGSLYVVWWALSAQSGCGPSVRIARATHMQKTRQKTLVMVPKKSPGTSMHSEPNVIISRPRATVI